MKNDTDIRRLLELAAPSRAPRLDYEQVARTAKARRRRDGVLVGMALALTVVIGAVTAARLGDGGAGGRIAATAASGGGAPPDAQALETGWSRAFFEPSAVPGIAFAVTSGDGFLVASGQAEARPAVWISRDGGRSWDRTLEDAREGSARAIVTRQDLVVAVGEAAGEPAVWISTDQTRSWRQLTMDVPTPGVLNAVTIVGSDVLAAGEKGGNTLTAGGVGDAALAVWTTSDAENLNEIALDTSEASVWSLVEHGNGAMGVGQHRGAPAIWQIGSDAGHLVDASGLSTGGQLGDVTSVNGRFIAVGQNEAYEPRAWISIDGQTWEPAVVDELPDLTGYSLTAVDGNASGLVAVGVERAFDDGSVTVSEGRAVATLAARLWYSADGNVWTPVRLPDVIDAPPRDVLLDPTGLVIVGGQTEASVWWWDGADDL